MHGASNRNVGKIRFQIKLSSGRTFIFSCVHKQLRNLKIIIIIPYIHACMHGLPSVVSVESSSGKVRHIAIEKAAARSNTLNHITVQS